MSLRQVDGCVIAGFRVLADLCSIYNCWFGGFLRGLRFVGGSDVFGWLRFWASVVVLFRFLVIWLVLGVLRLVGYDF